MNNEDKEKTSVISDEDLDTLIQGLEDYRERGVVDPWLLSNGKVLDPLAVLHELRELRTKLNVIHN